MHAILTLHDNIQSGELTRRRELNQGGAAIDLDLSSMSAETPVGIVEKATS